MRKYCAESRVLLALVACLVAVAGFAPRVALGQTVAQSTAVNFMSGTERSRGCLLVVQPGATLLQVQTGLGQPDASGAFGLRCVYHWESSLGGTATSTIDYFFDGNGKIYDMRDQGTTSAFPNFLISDAVVELLKNELQKDVNRIEDQQTRQLVTTALQSSNARLLMLATLRLQQELGQ